MASSNPVLFDDLGNSKQILSVLDKLEKANGKYADSAVAQNERIVKSILEIKAQALDLKNTVSGLGNVRSGGGNSIGGLATQVNQLARQQATYQAVLARNQQLIDLNTASVDALKSRISDLRTEYDSLDRADAKSIERRAEINAELKETSQVYNGLIRVTNEATRSTKAANNSYDELDQVTKKLRADLKAMPDAFNASTGSINLNNKAAVGLYNQIKLNDKALKTADANMGVFGRHVGDYGQVFQDLAGDLLGFTTVAGAIGVAFTAIKAGIGIIAEMDAIDTGLKQVTRDSEDFAHSQKFLIDTSDDLGVEYKSLVKSYKLLRAATKDTSLEGQVTDNIFHAVANAGARLQLSTEETEGALNALQQMISKSNVQMEELKGQLGDRLPGAMRIMASATGLTTGELEKMVKNGMLYAVDVLPKFANELDKVYGGDAQGKIVTMTAGWNRMTNAGILFIASFNENKKISTFFGTIEDGIALVLKDMTTLVRSNEWGAFIQLFTGNAAVGMAKASVLRSVENAVKKAGDDIRKMPRADRDRATEDLYKKRDQLQSQYDELSRRPYSDDNIDEEKKLKKQLDRAKARADLFRKNVTDQNAKDEETARRQAKEKQDADAAQADKKAKAAEAARRKAEAEANRAMSAEVQKSDATTSDSLAQLESDRQNGLIDEQSFIEQRLKITLDGANKREAILRKYNKSETDDYIKAEKEKKKADTDYVRGQTQLDLTNNKSKTTGSLGDLDRERQESDLTDVEFNERRHAIIVAGIKADQQTLKDANLENSELYAQSKADLLKEDGYYLSERLKAEKAAWKLSFVAAKDALDQIDRKESDAYTTRLEDLKVFYEAQRLEIEKKRSTGKLSDFDADSSLHRIDIAEIKAEASALQEALAKAKTLSHDYILGEILNLEKVVLSAESSDKEIAAAKLEIAKFNKILDEADLDRTIVLNKKKSASGIEETKKDFEYRKKRLEDQKRLQDEAISLVTKQVSSAFPTDGLDASAKGIISIYNKIHNHRQTLKAREAMSDAERKDAELKDLQDVAEAAAAIGTGVVNVLYSLEQQKTTQRLAEVDKRENYELSVVGDNESAKAAIQNKYDAQRKEIQHEQDVATRNKALFEILVNTAVAVTKALPNVALSILIGGLGLLEYGLTASAPLPQYYAGKNVGSVNSYEGPAIAGDRFGRELWFNENGANLVEKPSLINVGKNDVILPNHLTERLLNDEKAWAASAIIGRTKTQQASADRMIYQRDKYQAQLLASSLGSRLNAEAIGRAVGKVIEGLPIEQNVWDQSGHTTYILEGNTRRKVAQNKRRTPNG